MSDPSAVSIESQFAEHCWAACVWWPDGDGGRDVSADRHLAYLGFPVGYLGSRALSDSERDQAMRSLGTQERAFRGGGNPVDAWAAILQAVALGVPMSWPVLEYLQRSAEAISRVGEVPRAVRPQRLAEALGLTPAGRGRRADAWGQRDGTKFVLGNHYHAERTLQGRSHEEALERVAKKHGVSKSTVAQAWTKHRAWIERNWAALRKSPDSLS